MTIVTQLSLPDKVEHQTKWVLGLMFIYFIILVWGIQNNLPYLAEVDEPAFVAPALRIASSGNLNPGWFGNPGSTIIYPIALLFHMWFALVEQGSLFHANPQLMDHFNQNFATYYYLGRAITIAYAVFTLPLIYLLGKRLFKPITGLIGGWLLIFYPYFLLHAQMTRPDSATVFFVALTLWLTLRLYDKSTISRHFLVGLSIGFAIGTKFVLAALGPVYGLVCLLHVWQKWQTPQFKSEIAKCLAGFAMIFVGFVISSPYFFLDFETAFGNVLIEARSEHLGADGLSRWGNLWFYLTSALPTIIGWPQYSLALLAIGVGLWRRNKPQILVLSFICVYLIGISISPLHWVRWAFQILPVLVLLTAEGLRVLISFLTNQIIRRSELYTYLWAGLILLISANPIYQTVLHDIRQSSSSTRVLAREWLVENVPAGSKIGQEAYTAALIGAPFDVMETWTLGQDRVLENYIDEGFDFLVISSALYDRFYADPERSASQVQFYDSLAGTAVLVQEIVPSPTRGGPTIKIYQLPK